MRAWYTPADFEALAARQAEVGGEFAVAAMDRLAELLGTTDGTVRARFALSRRGPGWIGLEMTLQASLIVTCQRCLGPLELAVAEQVEFGVVVDESSAGLLPAGIEAVVPDGDRVSLLRLIEDEMIIAVPLVPKHAPESCAVDADALPEGVFTSGGTATTN
ncbi:MAG: YceD family protein [Gammaproteobacteria bacterium]